jgi:hypothetical protein
VTTFASQIDLSSLGEQGSGIDQQGTLTSGDFDPVVPNTILKMNKTQQIPLFLKFRSDPSRLALCLSYGLGSEGKYDSW